jgi:uncharacterized protein DUF5681
MQAPKRRGSAYGGQQEPVQGVPGPAAAAHPLPEGQSGNPRRPQHQELPALLADALDETVVVTIDGRRRKITKRDAIVAQMIDKSASADLRMTKMLIDMMKDVEAHGRRRGTAARTPSADHGRQGAGAAPRGVIAATDPTRDRRSEGGRAAQLARPGGRATHLNYCPLFSFMAGLVPRLSG